MTDFLKEICLDNTEALAHLEEFASHREQIDRLLLDLCAGNDVALLGAGNSNDVSLQWLSAHASSLILVDIDAGAMSRAATKAPRAVLLDRDLTDGLVTSPEVDLSRTPDLGFQAHVVASMGVLTQICWLGSTTGLFAGVVCGGGSV